MLASVRIAACLSLLLALAHMAWSQTVSQPAGTATVSGSVRLGEAPAVGIPLALVAEQGGRPAGRGPTQSQATAQAGAAQEKTAQVTTDEKGFYVFTNVAAGKYRVMLLTETLTNPSSDQRSSGTSVTVSDGQAVSQIDFLLARGGVITGRITDHDGRPVIAQRVTLMTVAEGAQPQGFNGGGRGGYETDDRGMYRIYGLPAGHYLVSAGTESNGGNRQGPGVNRRIRYPLTYYPNAADQTQAQIVDVASGSVVESIDIRLGEPLKTYAVTGRAVDAETGEPVMLIPINVGRAVGGQRGGPQGPAAAANSGASDTEGKFRITGLLPGRYSISVNAPGGDAETSSDFYNDPASFEISGADASGVEVKVHRGVSISGVVVIEGVTDPAILARLAQLSISATSRSGQAQGQGQGPGGGRGGASGRQSSAQVQPNGAFRISGLAPGTIRLNVNGVGGPGGPGGSSNGFSLMRIERNGVASNGDFAASSGEQVAGVRVVVGYGTGAIQGRVVVTGTQPAGGLRLMVTARQLDSSGQSRAAQVDAGGNFRVEGLLSGSYELRVMSLGGGFGGAPGGGRGSQQRGGGANSSQIQIPDVRQTITAVNGQVVSATLNLNLPQ